MSEGGSGGCREYCGVVFIEYTLKVCHILDVYLRCAESFDGKPLPSLILRVINSIGTIRKF